MNKTIKWIILSTFIVAMLLGTYLIIEKDRSARPESDSTGMQRYMH